MAIKITNLRSHEKKSISSFEEIALAENIEMLMRDMAITGTLRIE